MSTIETVTGRDRSIADARTARVAVLDALSAGVLRGLLWCERRLERRRTRLDLLELTEYQLKDIGLTRLDAINEGQRPFWD
jgi:uncharacterized protein YjiS (DUF1127 family)